MKEVTNVLKFKEGDHVFHHGVPGIVQFVNSDDLTYPVYVKFDNGVSETFTPDGKCFFNDDYPSLFHVDKLYSYTNQSIVDILKREGYDTMTDGNNIYVGRDGVVVATLIMRGKG